MANNIMDRKRKAGLAGVMYANKTDIKPSPMDVNKNIWSKVLKA